MSLLNVWNSIQPEIRTRISEPMYETWFRPLLVRETSPQTLLIETPDEFFKNWIIDNYLKIIQETLQKASHEPIQFHFAVQSESDESGSSSTRNEDLPSEPTPPKPNAPLRSGDETNPKFTFESFVVGPSNRFAYAACRAVADSPAKAYNPLFLYGKVGLGKTHLMQAIANQLQSQNSGLKFCYLSSERFTNELIEAIRHRKTQQFRQKYRHIDVLLIDDIHFIAGKESTQEEFFHTFNALHNNHKQIIISSDRPPREITNLEERLRSRFAWGLITDIQPPDYETRVAILRKKIEKEPVEVPDEVISFIAQEIKSNIRELEGALIRVVAYSLLEENPISLEMTKSILKDLLKETVKTITPDMIQRHVAHHFRVPVSDLKTRKRNQTIVLPRQLAMYLCRRLTHLSLPDLGRAFGGKDHTTILHACRKIEKRMEGEEDLKQTVETLVTEIQQL